MLDISSSEESKKDKESKSYHELWVVDKAPFNGVFTMGKAALKGI